MQYELCTGTSGHHAVQNSFWIHFFICLPYTLQGFLYQLLYNILGPTVLSIDTTLSSLVDGHKRSRGPCHLYLQDTRNIAHRYIYAP